MRLDVSSVNGCVRGGNNFQRVPPSNSLSHSLKRRKTNNSQREQNKHKQVYYANVHNRVKLKHCRHGCGGGLTLGGDSNTCGERGARHKQRHQFVGHLFCRSPRTPVPRQSPQQSKSPLAAERLATEGFVDLINPKLLDRIEKGK